MARRTISLSEDAYEALSARKRPHESFSDVVRRLARRRSLTDLAHVMDKEAAVAVAEAVGQNREKRLTTRRDPPTP